MKRVKAISLCLTGLCLMAAFTFGAVASASAAELEFVPGKGAFPVTSSGSGGKSTLETVGGSAIHSTATDVESRILNAHLFHLHLEFLNSEGPAGSECSNTSAKKTILVQLEGHLGLAHPGDVPAVLLLVPAGFEFTCTALGGLIKEKVKVSGEVIGEITSPILKQERSETFKFEQKKGVQKYTTFLLSGAGNALMTLQHQETKVGSGSSEESGQEGEATLTAAGTETIEIKDK
jgi:hypothetical protein